jgi:hypothetical protein
MKVKIIIHGFLAILLMAASLTEIYSQQRDWRIHERGMLHQTVFNTGELGRVYNAEGTVPEGMPSMEWPPYSRMILDRTNFPGQHNSFGSGIWLAGTRPEQGRIFAHCGAVSNTNGAPVPVVGVHSIPISIERIENYPVLEDGELNPDFNPDEAEEIIIAVWDTPLGVRVTRTSRAWSYPGYDSFIIYEYEFENRTNDTITDFFITFANTFAPSMFGYQRRHGQWSEGIYRGQPPAGEGDHFSRFDLKRWMTYNHERDGLPEETLFNVWSQPGDRGGLNSPQAAGLMVLNYDYDRISRRDQTEQVFFGATDSAGMWDHNDKAKQPFMLRYENGNLPAVEKTQGWMHPAVQRRPAIFTGINDSTYFAEQFEPELWEYWRGRTRGSTNLSWWQPVARAYGFYPYILPPGDRMTFAVAEVVGYGPGGDGDHIYSDLGGNVRAGVDAGRYFNPVASWYRTLEYDFLGEKPFIGSDYLQNNPLPWYVTPGVVSIRDVADRAIEIYTGEPLVKHDTLQYEPLDAPPTGRYNTIPIPVPAPAIRVENTQAAANRITWGPQVESFDTPRLKAPFSHYLVLRAPHPLGPWMVMDSVAAGDPVYFNGTEYETHDLESDIGDNIAYAVVSVDTEGGRSGKTNLIVHETRAPATDRLERVYVIPNPLVLTSGARGSDLQGEITDRVRFMGLTERCTIRIFSYTGQLIQTIEHRGDSFSEHWYQLTVNNQIIASGVYFFVVEDNDTGERAHGKFVVIH